MNKVFLKGRLGKDFEVKTTTSGVELANTSLATSEKWKDKKTGEQKEKVEWHRLKVFGARASTMAKFLKKGDEVLVSGSMQYGDYEKDGHKVYTADVVVDNFWFCGSRNNEVNSVDPTAMQNEIPW